jgi:hypothetical protein
VSALLPIVGALPTTFLSFLSDTGFGLGLMRGAQKASTH